jgi:hypothetical protein
VNDLADLLRDGRREAEALMVDTCKITRPDPNAPSDPITGAGGGRVVVYPDPAWPDDHPWKNGPCKVQAGAAQERNPEAGGYSYTVQRYEVHLPVGAYAPHVRDDVEVTTSLLDPHLAGRHVTVTALLHKSMATAYRLAVTDGSA